MNKIIINKPNENSKPAKPNKKKEVDNKFISSFKDHKKTDITNKIIHVKSEYKSKLNKLFEFKKNKKKESQNKLFQNINQLCIKNYL